MREERARRWRCKIDDLVAFFFVFLYIKVYIIVLASVFL